MIYLQTNELNRAERALINCKESIPIHSRDISKSESYEPSEEDK